MLAKSSLTVIGCPKLDRASAGRRVALYLQTRRPTQNRRLAGEEYPAEAVVLGAAGF